MMSAAATDAADAARDKENDVMESTDRSVNQRQARLVRCIVSRELVTHTTRIGRWL